MSRHSQEDRAVERRNYVTVGEIALRAEGFPGTMRAASMQLRRSGGYLAEAAAKLADAAKANAR